VIDIGATISKMWVLVPQCISPGKTAAVHAFGLYGDCSRTEVNCNIQKCQENRSYFQL